MGLTVRQRRFAEIYDGNATEAAIAAGYSERWAGTNGDKLMKNTNIAEAIKEREDKRLSSLIATREERQKFWTATLRNEDLDLRDRLRASELLGKSEGDFLEKMLDITPQEPPNIEIRFIDSLLEDPEARKALSVLYDKTVSGRPAV